MDKKEIVARLDPTQCAVRKEKLRKQIVSAIETKKFMVISVSRVDKTVKDLAREFNIPIHTSSIAPLRETCFWCPFLQELSVICDNPFCCAIQVDGKEKYGWCACGRKYCSEECKKRDPSHDEEQCYFHSKRHK